MLLGNQAKKIAATIVGGEKKDSFVQELGEEGQGRPSFEKEAGESPDGVSDMDLGLDAATDKMMSALKSDDKAAFRQGLKSFIEMTSLFESDEDPFDEAEEV